MHIVFSEKDRQKILANIKEALGSRKLAEMIDFALEPTALVVTIEKLGTTVLNFAEKATTAGIEYTLAGEKVAFTHRAFKAEVTEKIIKVIEKAGGKVQR